MQIAWWAWLMVPGVFVLLWLLARILRDPAGLPPEDDRPVRGAAAAPLAPAAPPARTGDPLHADLRELLRAGRKIEAIKRYRELTGLGLAEAKAAVDALERGQPLAAPAAFAPLAAAPPARSPGGEPSPAQWDMLSELVRARQKIEAIKRYREITGLGLKESKEAIDALAARLGA